MASLIGIVSKRQSSATRGWGKALVGIAVVATSLSVVAGCQPNKPQMPVIASRRPSVRGADYGDVLQLFNATNQPLTLEVRLKGINPSRSSLMVITLPASGVEEIGWVEGWPLRKGDEVTVINPAYQDLTATYREK